MAHEYENRNGNGKLKITHLLYPILGLLALLLTLYNGVPWITRNEFDRTLSQLDRRLEHADAEIETLQHAVADLQAKYRQIQQKSFPGDDFDSGVVNRRRK